MYLIEQDIANEIAKEGWIEPREVREIFQADTEEEAERLEQIIRDRLTIKTGNSQIGRAIAVYSPILWANKAITSYINRSRNHGLRRIAPELLTVEETAILAQMDLRLDEEEVYILIEELRLQGGEV